MINFEPLSHFIAFHDYSIAKLSLYYKVVYRQKHHPISVFLKEFFQQSVFVFKTNILSRILIIRSIQEWTPCFSKARWLHITPSISSLKLTSLIVMFLKQFVKLTFFVAIQQNFSKKILLIYCLRDTITPLSIGCTRLIVLGGRNFTMIPSHCNYVVAGYGGVLSPNESFFRKNAFLKSFLIHGTIFFFFRTTLHIS